MSQWNLIIHKNMSTNQSLHKTVIRGLIGAGIYMMFMVCATVMIVAYVVLQLNETISTEAITATSPVIDFVAVMFRCITPIIFIAIMGVVEYAKTKNIKNVLFGSLVVAPVLLMIIYGILFLAYAVIVGLLLGIAESGGF